MGVFGKALTPEEHQRRVGLVQQGLTAYAMAKAEGVTEAAIHNWAKRHGITLVQGKASPQDVNRRRLERLARGATVAQALAGEGLRSDSVTRWVQRHGVSRQDRPLAALDDRQKQDVLTLVLVGDYPLCEALAIVQRPKVKISFRVAS